MVDVEYTPGTPMSTVCPISSAARQWFIDTPWTFAEERDGLFHLDEMSATTLVAELRDEGFCVEEPGTRAPALHPVAFLFWDQAAEDGRGTGWCLLMRGADGVVTNSAYPFADDALAAAKAAGISDVSVVGGEGE